MERRSPMLTPQDSSTKSAASSRTRRGDWSTLDTYLDGAGTYDLLTAEQELEVARELMSLRHEYWEALLSLPSLVLPIVDAIDPLLGDETVPAEHDARLRSALAQLRRQPSAENANQLRACNLALAHALSRVDIDNVAADALSRDIERLASGERTEHLNPREAPRAELLGAYRKRVVRARARLRNARNRFVCANLRLVVRVAQRYSRNRLSLPDLVQEGNLGLMKAVDRFDPDKGCRFSTYAAWWIRHAITRALVNRGRTVRIPAHLHTVFTKSHNAARVLAGELGREPTLAEISDRIDVPQEKIKIAKEAMELSSIAFDAPASPSDTRTVADVLEAPDAASWFDALDAPRNRAVVGTAVDDLDPLERDIIRHRYGLRGEHRMTLQKLGEQHQLSRERIRQLQKKALYKLREVVDQHPARTTAYL